MNTERLRERLQDLRAQSETCQRMLADLDVKRAEIQQSLLRLAGAVQVLEELIGEQAAPGSGPGSASPP